MTKAKRRAAATTEEAATDPSDATAAEASPLTTLIVSHFDAHQRRGATTHSDVEARAARLKKEISDRLPSLRNKRYSSTVVNDENENPQSRSKSKSRKSSSYDEDSEEDEEDYEEEEAIREEITDAIIQCVDAAFASSLSSTTACTTTASSNNTEEATQRIFELAAAFCADPLSTDDFDYLNRESFSALWERAALASRAALDPVRSNGCKLIGVCLRYLLVPSGSQVKKAENRDRGESESEEDEEEWEDEEWVKTCHRLAEKALLPRLTDKSQAVRNAAIRACAFFFPTDSTDQQPYHPDKIEKALLSNMSHDPSFANRSAAVQAVPITDTTIPHLLERIRDVKLKVRVDALEVLKDKADVMQFSEDDRIDVLRYGLTGRCPSTAEAARKMLCHGWMKSCKFDPVELLRVLDPVTNETVCEVAMRTIIGVATDEGDGSKTSDVLSELSGPERRAFKSGVCDYSIDVENETLDPAVAFLLRVRCVMIAESQTLSASRRMDQLNKLVPDLLVLCEVLQKHLGLLVGSVRERESSGDDDDNGQEGRDDEEEEEKELQFEEAQCFICLQLLQVATKADLKEEGGRRHLLSFMHTMLCSSETPDDLVEACIRAMAAMSASESDFLRSISDALKEVNKYDADVETPTEENDELHSRQNRALSIISVVLEHTTRTTTSDPALRGFSDTILPCVSSPSDVIREAAVSCLGKYALLVGVGTVVLSEIKPLLMNAAGNEEEVLEVRAHAVLALCDLALLYDDVLSPISPYTDDEQETTQSSLPEILESQLSHSNGGLVVIAAEACMKLLLAKKLKDPATTIARLVIIFFNMSSACTATFESADEASELGSPVRLEQLLSVFFPAYGMSSAESRMALLESVKPMLRMADEKPPGRKSKKRMPSSSLPIAKMVEYVCSNVNMGEQSTSKAATDTQDDQNEEATDEAKGDKEAKDAPPLSKVAVLNSIAEFLLEESSSLSITYLRTVCKIMGGIKEAEIGCDSCSDDFVTSNNDASALKALRCLKENLDELNMVVTDHYALSSIEKLVDILDSVEGIEEEDESVSTEDDEPSEEENDDDDSEAVEEYESDKGNDESCSHTGNDASDNESVESSSVGSQDSDESFSSGNDSEETETDRSTGESERGSSVAFDSLQSLGNSERSSAAMVDSLQSLASQN